MHASGTATNPRSVDDLVLQEQIALTCRQYGIMAASSIAADALLVYFFYGKVPISALMVWLGVAVVSVGFAMLVIFVAARTRQAKFRPVRRWTMLLSVTAFAGGAAWGSAGLLLFVPASLVDQQYLLILLLGGASLVMVMMAAYRPAFYAALVPMLLPITVRLLASGDAMSMLLGIVPIVYGATLGYFYNNIHATLLASLKLRFELAQTAGALAEQKSRAEQANQAKSRFLAAASHDLRQPLHAQGLFVEELQARSHDADFQRILSNLRCSVEAMHDLFDSLLDISRLDASVVAPSRENFSINVLLRELQRDFSPLARQKGLTLRVVGSRAVVHSDPSLLKRILCNLVANAIRYTNRGKVLIGCRRRGNQLRIEVCDTGIGIRTDDLASIFEEFHQLHNPERDRRKGLGLGLAIVQRLATLLNCPIDVRSQINKGSSFCVTVPFVGTAMVDVSPPSATVDRNIDLSGHTILVIDDEPEILRGMKGLLEQWGCRVLTAESIAESIAQATAHAHTATSCLAAIVADYRLRDQKTGIDAIACIRSLLNENIPGVLITGDTAPERLQEAYASGYRILHKPVPPARLRALLGYVIRTRSPATALETNIA